MPKIRLSFQHPIEILKLIRSNGSIARADVLDKTGGSPFLVSKSCDQLLEGQFIREAGFGDSTGGRRPTLLSLTPGLGRLLGIHIGTYNARVALTDFSGNLIAYHKSTSRAVEGPDVAIPHLFDLIDNFLAQAGVDRSQLNGIGIGISGVLDRETGVTLYWPKLPLWIDVPVKQIFEQRYGTLVRIEDTSRTRALAEFNLGGARESEHFLFIGIGGGTGAALFLNGSLYAGFGGFAGEFGHMTVAEKGPLCSCGNRGCLETLVSSSALLRKARHGMAQGLSNSLTRITDGKQLSLTIESLALAAREGDRFTLRLLTEAGGYLGRGIVGLVNLLNPELIVLGGGIAAAVGEYLMPEVQRIVRDNAMIQSARQVHLRCSTLSEDYLPQGATMLVAEEALIAAFLEWQNDRQLKPEASVA